MNPPPEPFAGLIREHRLIERMVTTAQERIVAALAAPEDTGARDAAIEHLWNLQLLLESDLEIHIAKEELVLFPAARQETRRLSELVDAFIDEHERIKAQRDLLSEALTMLDDDHSDVRASAARLRAELDQLGEGGSGEGFALLHAEVERLDWLFQGHFVGEEDGLFAPLEDTLSAPVLAELTAQMDLIERQRAGRPAAR